MKKLLIVCLVLLAVPVFGQEGLLEPQPQENFAFINTVKGRVLLKEEPAQQNQYVYGDDWIITEKGARVEIRFGEQGGFLTIDENSKVFFVEVGSGKSVVALFQGTVYLRHLEGMELRAAGKPEGKIILPQKDQIVRVDIVGDNVEVENDPDVRDNFDSFNQKREKETRVENVETESNKKSQVLVRDDCYPRIWRVCGLYLSLYPGWYPWHSMYYNYGYYYLYYQYQYGYNQYGYNQNQYYGGSNSNSYGSRNSSRQVVTKNQLQNRQITVRSSRTNSFPATLSTRTLSTRTSSVRPTKPLIGQTINLTNRPSRTPISNVRPSRPSSLKSVPTPRTQQRSGYRVPTVPTSSRNVTTVSRSSSSSTNRPVTSGVVRKK